MFEKVNPSHPDKIADRIAGAIVDLAYVGDQNPKVAVEVLIGHGECHIIVESSVNFEDSEIKAIVERIAGEVAVDVCIVPQDEHLAKNQDEKIRCGDNGIFRGVPTTGEQKRLSKIMKDLYAEFPTDGKAIMDGSNLIVCQSCANDQKVVDKIVKTHHTFINKCEVNPLGYWTGGTDVDSGATNRKLGSDMGDAVTGGGLHGKDLSKADVSLNIYAHIRANQLGEPVSLYCAIGDEYVDGLPYSAIVEVARDYIFNHCGGFEKFAEWGLI